MSTDRTRPESDGTTASPPEGVTRLDQLARLCAKTSQEMFMMLMCGRLGGYVGRDDEGFFLTPKDLRRFLADNGFSLR